ncbi:hypothetical protein HZU67_05502 [Apis mellifera carnica]|nr:hypothetical protein HZU67_05502 [Apis mellifera carnica]
MLDIRLPDGLGRSQPATDLAHPREQEQPTPMIDAPGATSSSASALPPPALPKPPSPLAHFEYRGGPPQIRDVPSHVECRRTHVEDILPVNAGQAARSSQPK